MNLRQHKKKLIAAGLLTAILMLIVALPYLLKPTLELSIRAQGFPKARVGNIRFMHGGIYIDQILLDPNGFSTVDDIQVSASLANLLGAHKADNISIKNISLSGEIAAATRITIAGWEGKLAIGDASPKPLPFDSLFIDKITLDMDTPAGAIRTESRVDVHKSSKGYAISTSLSANQNQFTSDINFSGTYDVNGDISGKADFGNTSINTEKFGVSRLAGWIEIQSLKNLQIIGQLMAGGARVNQIPFEDTNISFDTKQNPQLSIKTHATGKDMIIDAELGKAPKNKLTMTVTGASLGEIVSLFSPDAVTNDWLINTGPMQLSLNIKDDFIGKPQVPMTLDLLFQKTTQHITTDINFAPSSMKIAGRIKDAKMKAHDIAAVLPKEMNINSSTGDVGISGTYTADFMTTPADIKANLIFTLSNIDTSSLTKKDNNGFVVDGKMNGVIPMEISGDKILIHNGQLKSLGGGHLKYPSDQLPQSLQGDDERLKTVRLALQDYSYNELVLTLDGDLNGDLKTNFSAKGKSQALENRPVNLNLNLEGALASAIRQALQPGQLGSKLQEQINRKTK